MSARTRRISFAFGSQSPRNGWLNLVWFFYSRPQYPPLAALISAWFFRFFGLKVFLKHKFLKFILGPAIQKLPAPLVLALRRRYVRDLRDGALAVDPVIAKLDRDGFCDLSNRFQFSPAQIDRVRAFFLASPAYNSHVPIKSDLRQQVLSAPSAGSYFSFSPEISLQCAPIREFVNSPEVHRLAREYLGFEPYLYSINTMLTRPTGAVSLVTDIHRDFDDFMFITFFVYWTAVDKDNGSTSFLKGSHFSDEPGEQVFLEGGPGSVFVLDPYGLHAGNKSVKNDRLVTWMRFGQKPNFTYIIDKNFYVI